MKKLKMTYWLLGFGCGIILSGIVGVFCSLNIRLETSAINHNEPTTVVGNNSEEENKPIKHNIEKEYKSEKYEEENAKSDTQALSNEKIEDVKETSSTIQVHIPTQSGATDIAQILKLADVIDDANAFISFIKDQNKATQLKHGDIVFSKNLTYEQVLEILTYN